MDLPVAGDHVASAAVIDPSEVREAAAGLAHDETHGADVPLVHHGLDAAVDRAPRRRRRKKAGLIEIELGGGRRIRVDRDVDAAALERVLDVLARR